MRVAIARGRLLPPPLVSAAFLLTVVATFGQDAATGVLTNGRSMTLNVGQKLPWSSDIIRHVKPEYPAAARAKDYHGSGIIRLVIDPTTGIVTSALVRRSTGYRVLDESAVNALRRWRWKPGTWKQVDIPVRFTVEPHR
jgi:TonB family protein